MSWIKILSYWLGIDAKSMENRASLRQLKLKGKQAVLRAETKSKITFFEAGTKGGLSNDEADNRIDLEMTKQKAKSWKDDIVSYLVLAPLASAVVTPFLSAYKTGDWILINENMIKCFKALSELPNWYIVCLVLIIADALALRRIASSLLEKINFSGFVPNLFKKKEK